MNEIYYYSAKHNGFYVESMRADYNLSGSWPADAVAITESTYQKLLDGQVTGKIIVANKKGQPVLADPAAPTKEVLIGQAEITRAELVAEAAEKIAPLQDAVELDIATDKEAATLLLWKRYRVMLSRLDLSTAPDIEWPERPAE